MADLDPRDFVEALERGIFLSLSSTFLTTVAGSEMGFLPSVDVQPIRSQLQAVTFVENTDTPSLFAFDIDLESERMYLHFTDVMDMSSFRSTEFTLHNTIEETSYTLSQDSRPEGVEENLVKTICVTLDDTRDLPRLTEMSICVGEFLGCSCSFSSQLALSYNNIFVQDVSPENPLRVSYNKVLQALSPKLQPYPLAPILAMNIYGPLGNFQIKF